MFHWLAVHFPEMIDSSCLQQTVSESALRACRWHLSDLLCYPKVPLITVTCGKTYLEQIMPISLSAHISAMAWQGFFHCWADSLQERSTVSLAWQDVGPRVRRVTNKAWAQITAAFRKKEIVADGLWLDLKFTRISKSGTDIKCRPGV